MYQSIQLVQRMGTPRLAVRGRPVCGAGGPRCPEPSILIITRVTVLLPPADIGGTVSLRVERGPDVPGRAGACPGHGTAAQRIAEFFFSGGRERARGSVEMGGWVAEHGGVRGPALTRADPRRRRTKQSMENGAFAAPRIPDAAGQDRRAPPAAAASRRSVPGIDRKLTFRPSFPSPTAAPTCSIPSARARPATRPPLAARAQDHPSMFRPI